MRKILPILFPSALSLTAFCQEDSVLKNFKYRINHYTAVTISAGGNSQFINYNVATSPDKNSYTAGNLSGDYYFLKSTDRVLFTANAGIGSGFNFAKRTYTLTDNRSKSFSSSAYFNLLNKWFNRNSFTELGADINSGIQTNKTNDINTTSSRDNLHDFSLAIHAGIGKGRLENITDMQNALWLSQSLTDEHQLARSLSVDELNELGRMITKANNTRVLDSRKRVRFILESIDDYLQHKKLITTTDIRYFSNLNDILFFAFNNSRLSGTEKYIRITPAINYSGENQTDDTLFTHYEDRTTSKSVSLSIGISQYHPVNLKHQNNMGVSLFGNYISEDYSYKFFNSGILTSLTKLTPVIKQAGINLFFQHAIYPNTRTIVSFDLQSQSGIQWLDPKNDFFSNNSLSASLNYFISYRTRLQCSLGAIYQKNLYSINPVMQNYNDILQLFATAGVGISL